MIRALWHLAFYWNDGYSAWGPLGWFGWAPFYVAYTYVFTWLYTRSGGSVPFAAVALVPILWKWFPRRRNDQGTR